MPSLPAAPSHLLAMLALLLLVGGPIEVKAEGFSAEAALQASQAAIGRSVGDYAFTNHLNRPVRLSEFRGRPLVINMVYTACADICPTVSGSLADAVSAARDALGRESFAVITIGFDARRDTPERMRAYARRNGLAIDNWVFLSGEPDSVSALAEDIGFLFLPAPQGFDHVAQTTIIDAEGQVYRQIYGSTFDPPALVEPLKELVWGQRSNPSLTAGLLDRIRLICTVYDPASGRYRFSYAIFISIGLSGLTLVAMAVVLVRAWLRLRPNSTS